VTSASGYSDCLSVSCEAVVTPVLEVLSAERFATISLKPMSAGLVDQWMTRWIIVEGIREDCT
jgi:hypothetical protein